ncbi:MAG: hypothetical protein QM710_14240 [Flavobacterium sp.]
MQSIEVERAGAPYLFRYRPNNENTLKEIEKNYIYFANNKQLNDPFDAHHKMLELPNNREEIQTFFSLVLDESPIETREYLKRRFLSNPGEFFDLVNNGTEAFMSRFGIACFTMSQINVMLWATYANNHQGLCIQYNCDLDKTFFNGIRVVDYVDKFEKTSVNSGNGFTDPFFKKLKLWRNEYELRLIKEVSGEHQYDPLAARSIILGLRSSEEFKEKVTKIIRDKQSHIKLYSSSVLPDSYGLTLTEIQ